MHFDKTSCHISSSLVGLGCREGAAAGSAGNQPPSEGILAELVLRA